MKLFHFSTLRPRRNGPGAPLQVGDLEIGWGLIFANGVCTPLWGARFAILRMRAKNNPGTPERPSPEEIALRNWCGNPEHNSPWETI